MEKTFKVVQYNQPDSQGDVFAPGCIKAGRVPVLANFDVRHPVGFAEVKAEEDGLYVTTKVKDEYKGLYPAIGFSVIKSHKEGDIRFIDEMKLYCVSIGDSNVDPTIPPIQ